MLYRSLVSTLPNIQNNVIQIGSSVIKDSNMPLNANYNYSWSAHIYTQFEVGNKAVVGNDEKAKIITGIDVYHADVVGQNLSNQNIYLGHINQFIFNTIPQVNLSDLTVTDLTLCKSSFSTSFQNNKWVTYNFDTNFDYNGTKNLILIWEDRSGIISASASSYCTSTKNAAAYAFNNISFPSGNGVRSNNRLNIKLRF